MIRLPAVAGRFYREDPALLRADLRSYLSNGSAENDVSAINVSGCIVPHAGYVYSGHVAGAVFGRISIPRLCIVIGPNHTGLGRPLSIMSEGAWQTPLGEAPVASDLAKALKEEFTPLTEDEEAHHAEHAIEVELPFLQLLRPDVSFVPLTLGTRQFDLLEALGQAVAKIITACDEPVLIVASTDMNHYESDALTRAKDAKAIAQILSLDPLGLFEAVRNENISMCGLGPVITLLSAVKHMGAMSAELIKYATSGEISGDYDLVVGYAGMTVTAEAA